MSTSDSPINGPIDLRCLCFFFQAEDGIRDLIVTGVQTCALPISVTDTLLTGTAGASWGPDGFIYVDANTNGGGLLRVEAKPGARPSWFTVLDTASGEFDHTWPDVLPNGKGVLFTALSNRR